MSLYIGYEPATRCTGGPTPGARALMSWFLGAYGKMGAHNLGIYNCRSVVGGIITSLHGEGRAADLGVEPEGSAWAWVLAESLMRRSGELGIQLIIWDRKVWSGSYPDQGWRPYLGLAEHRDHLHVELSRASAASLTAEHIQRVLHTPGPRRRLLDVRTPRMQGGDIMELQAGMNKVFPSYSRLAVDGWYGPSTAAVVREFQRRAGLYVDGVVGPRTWAALAHYGM